MGTKCNTGHDYVCESKQVSFLCIFCLIKLPIPYFVLTTFCNVNISREIHIPVLNEYKLVTLLKKVTNLFKQIFV